jgi:hypothetical protein
MDEGPALIFFSPDPLIALKSVYSPQSFFPLH